MKRLGMMMLAFALAQVAWAGEKLTYVDLVERLTDLERLALLPEPGEHCAQMSSYDHRSRYDEESGKYIDWDANEDGFGESGGIRDEASGRVLAEMKGPGCIWRIWSADPQGGSVRIYLDGSKKPAVDLSFQDYFSGEQFPFTFSSLVYESARGRNCYIPIPYQKSCKVVADEGYGQFFHFTYSTFPKRTRVPAFKRQLTVEEASALARADKVLSRRGVDPAGGRPGEQTEERRVYAPAGGRTKVLELSGAGAITGIRAKIDLPEATEARRVLRELALSIQWDGEKVPSVWAPLGDFFGTAPGANIYHSLPLGLGEDGWWYCFWYMPFSEGAKVALINDGREDQEVAFEITFAPLSQPIGSLGRFHAKWHRDAFLPEDPGRQIDWPMLKTSGRGRYCGAMLHVWSPSAGWWGEGDEKFFVDGERFPSTFGTGSEDYFGYAWGDSAFFERPYHDQTLCENTSTGHVSVNRWQIVDNVPFQTSFEGCIEKYFGNERPALYASTVYWYLAPGGVDPYPPVEDVWERLGYIVNEVQPPTTPQWLFVHQGEVLLKTETEGAKIRYTLDGTEPTLDAPLYTGPIPLNENTTVKARAYKEGCYASMVSTFPIVMSEYRGAEHPEGIVNGLQFEYYDGDWVLMPDFSEEPLTSVGTTDVFGVTPALALDDEMELFALKFNGYIRVPADGVYDFYTRSDDGSQLWIGDQLIVNNDGLHSAEEKSGSVALRAGLHSIRVTFFEQSGDEVLEVFYRGESIPKQPIPAGVLYRNP